MPRQPLGWRNVWVIAIWVIPILFIHYGLERSSAWLVPLFAVSFFGYLWIYFKVEWNFKQILMWAILVRLALFLGTPSLSDDYFRFIWDGKIWNEGFNPYQSTPENLIQELPNEFNTLYDQLNSQSYHSTYPPLSQYLFATASWLNSKDVFWSMNILRGILLMFEIGVILLIYQFTQSTSKVLLFAFNPLVVLELTGNLHFEGVVLCFILLAWGLNKKTNWIGGAVALSMGVLTKLIPLMFLPVLFKKIGLRRSIGSYLIIGVAIILLSLPFIELDLIKGMGNGLNLFFRKFEFNAGLFFLIREIGFWVKGYDVVQTAGPWLAAIAFVLIVSFTLFNVDQKTQWAYAFMIILFIQLLFATTIHPWYVIPLLAFGCFTGYAFPMVWSGLIFLSYLGYTHQGYEHPMFWIALEYLVVISVAAFELFKNKPLLKNV